MEEAIRKTAEEKIGKKRKDSVLKLEESIRNTRLSNDKLSRQLFTLNNRIINVAEKIGFPAFEDLEGAVLDDPDVWNIDAIKANHAQAAKSKNAQSQIQERDRHDDHGLGGFREEFEQLRHQVLILQQRSDTKSLNMHVIEPPKPTATKRSPLTPLKSAENTNRSEESNLRAQLHVLSHKYDALVAAKESAEKKYKEDYTKWKYFKSWLLNKSKHAKALRAQLAAENLDFGVGFQADGDGHNDETSLASSRRHSSPARSMDGKFMFSRSSPARPSRATPERVNHLSKRQPLRSLELVGSENRFPRTIASWSDSPSPKARKRKEPHSEPNNTSKPIFVEGASRIKTETLSSPEIPHLSTKGKGRYADVASAGEAINALYEIDTSRNNGLAFQFDEVVRGREHRQRLEAGDCDCCKEYYDRVEPLPSRLAPPAWDSFSIANVAAAPQRHHGRHPQLEATEHHKKQISRHRHQWSPSSTPPDYWNIGFPTTQEAADINRRAADMHADKRRRVEKEANTTGGRYIRRHDNK